MNKRIKDKNPAETNRFVELLKSPAVHRILILTAVLVIVIFLVLVAIGIRNESKQESEDVVPDIPLQEIQSADLPDIITSYGNYENYLSLTDLNEDPIGSLHELDEYSRSFRIIHSYEGVSDGESMTLTKSGECVRAESDSRVIIKNKSKVLSDYGVQRIVSETDDEGFCTEVGITSLSMLREMCFDEENFEKEIILSDDKRFVTADLYDRHTGISMSFEIDVETGIIITERFYIEGILYRFVFTENISKNINIDAGFFEIIE